MWSIHTIHIHTLLPRCGINRFQITTLSRMRTSHVPHYRASIIIITIHSPWWRTLRLPALRLEGQTGRYLRGHYLPGLGHLPRRRPSSHRHTTPNLHLLLSSDPRNNHYKSETFPRRRRRGYLEISLRLLRDATAMGESIRIFGIEVTYLASRCR